MEDQSARREPVEVGRLHKPLTLAAELWPHVVGNQRKNVEWGAATAALAATNPSDNSNALT